MENIEEKDKIYKFNCINCDYHTNRPCDWIKHIESNKHKRRGEKKTTKCDLCDYVGLTHWNVKLHKLSQHSTDEEKANSKYYCKSCNKIFFCSLYMDKHINGIGHKNMVKALELQKQVDDEYIKNKIL